MSENNETVSFDGLVFEAVKVEVSNHIMTLTLNRPEKKNAINAVMTNELIYAFDLATRERGIRVIVIAATGDHFCSGGDLTSMRTGSSSPSQSTVPKQGEMSEIVLRMRQVCKPVIIKAHGDVMAGALMFICNATHVIAAEQVTFSAPEIKRGLWPFMVMAGLFRVMPRRIALDFIMRGYKIDTQTAKQYGLINASVPQDQLDETVAQLAKELTNLAPSTMRLGLEAFYQQELMAFDEAIPYLMNMLGKTIQSKDAQEGLLAFAQKRAPVWES
ncbi:enoyl-CoA hydratase-related protein [Deltaproteobacteria bacterium TL4]